jgi:Zn-finger nucleic acid-binding protein
MQQPWGGDHRGYPQHGGYNKYGHPKRRKSFLEELFD